MLNAYVVTHEGHHRIACNPTAAEAEQSIPIVLDYLAEGGANIIYRILPFAAGACISTPVELQTTVLRLRKDKPSITNTKLQHETFAKTITPLFGDGVLLDQSLIAIDQDVLRDVNNELCRLDESDRRASIRRGDLVALDEEYGLTMPDMTATGLDVLLEIKPKWLLQSPNAPHGSRRCRTCALRAQRAALKAEGLSVPTGTIFCPLSLLVEDLDDTLAAATAIVNGTESQGIPDAVKGLASVLRTTAAPFLRLLRDLQLSLDPHGVLAHGDGDQIPNDLGLAMTLRDCTLFVKVKEGRLDDSTELRLADLDLKQAHPDKLRKWRAIEKRLIDYGWYINAEQCAEPEVVCMLSKLSSE